MSYYVAFSFWLMLLLLAAMAVRGLLGRVGGGKWLRVLFFPGLVVHQLSCVALCMLTFAKIRRVTVLDGPETQVEHERSRLRLFGEMLIALAPIAGCGLALWPIAAWLGYDLEFGLELPIDLPLSADGVAELAGLAVTVTRDSFEAILSEYLGSLRGMVFLYFCLALTTYMAPGRRELGLAALGIALFAVCLVLYDSSREGTYLFLFSYKYGAELIKRVLWPPVAFFLSLQAFMLVMSLAVAGISRLLGGSKAASA